jgi:hypothetical protein
MKLKSLMVSLCLSACSVAFAGQQSFTQVNGSDPLPASKHLSVPGYCEVEVINQSYDNITVYGTYENGVSIEPFSMYQYDTYHIPLYYNYTCSDKIYVDIVTFKGVHIYSAWTRVGQILRIVPSYFNGPLNVELEKT